MFDRRTFDRATQEVARQYEKTAPTVEAWCDWLCSETDDVVTLADVALLLDLYTDSPSANYAANRVYHHQVRMGRDTTGQAGF